MVEKESVVLAVNILNCHKLSEGIRSVAVDPADKISLCLLIKCLVLLHTVVDDRSHCKPVLPVFRDIHNSCQD